VVTVVDERVRWRAEREEGLLVLLGIRASLDRCTSFCATVDSHPKRFWRCGT
jgi:hypothetical protein